LHLTFQAKIIPLVRVARMLMFNLILFTLSWMLI